MCLAVNPPPFDNGGKGVGAGRGIVRMQSKQAHTDVSITKSERDGAVLGGYAGRGGCDNNIKRSQLVAVTAYLIYWFV